MKTNEAPKPAGVLAGVRVLDLSRVLAAPMASQFLGDMGAEILKVERPGEGDDSRRYGPPFIKDREGKPTQESAFYLSCNRNKKSVTIDFAKEEGQALIRRMAGECDVVLENFRTGALKKYGLDYESLKAVNPRLIYCSVTGFGQTGPLAQKPGYDGIFQAMCGLMSVSGHADDAPGGGPMKVGLSIVDLLTSLYSTMAIIGALYHRDAHGGEGQFIDMALLDCGLATLSHFAMNYIVSGTVPKRRGNAGYGGVPSQSFTCADRDIFLVCGTDPQYRRLCEVIGHPELIDDPRFKAGSSRIENRDVLSEVLNAIFKTRPAAEWLERLDAADVPCSAVNDLPAAMAEPQVKARNMLVEVEHSQCGPVTLLRNPIRYSKTPIDTYAAPPVMGEHTEEILAAFGIDAATLAGLRQRGVV